MGDPDTDVVDSIMYYDFNKEIFDDMLSPIFDLSKQKSEEVGEEEEVDSSENFFKDYISWVYVHNQKCTGTDEDNKIKFENDEWEEQPPIFSTAANPGENMKTLSKTNFDAMTGKDYLFQE